MKHTEDLGTGEPIPLEAESPKGLESSNLSSSATEELGNWYPPALLMRRPKGHARSNRASSAINFPSLQKYDYVIYYFLVADFAPGASATTLCKSVRSECDSRRGLQY